MQTLSTTQTAPTMRRALPQETQRSHTLDADKIIVRGAQQHNLKNIDITIPRYKFVVLTGVSGSGKSSLAFDTIYAEGQRRYVESLSPFIRHYLDKVEKPKVDFIGGLSPAIAIEQKTVSKNPRSTVGTVTEVMHYLRLLFSRVGIAHCTRCGQAIHPQSAVEIMHKLADLPTGTHFTLLAPVVRQRKGSQAEVIIQALRDGYTHARVDGKMNVPLQDLHLPENKKHSLELIVGQIAIPSTADYAWNDHLLALVRKSLRHGHGALVAKLADETEILLSEQRVCSHCGNSFPELTSQYFSPNSPHGMCTECNGLGHRLEVDPDLIVEDPTISIFDGALRWYGNMRKKKSQWNIDYVRSVANHYGADLELPWHELPADFRHALIYGNDTVKIHIQRQLLSENGSWVHESDDVVHGIISDINRRFRQTSSESAKRFYMSFMSERPCSGCNGTRISTEVRSVKLLNQNIHDVGTMTLDQVKLWLDTLYQTFDDEAFEIAHEILKEASQRIQFMLNVGLHYLTLDRPAPTLSGGEGQRIRLASQLSCGLVGVLYVLDEPSIGLHARDQHTLLQTLLQLRDIGNTVLVVEHDEETMRNADWLIDMGPGAGVLGGTVVVAGPPQLVEQEPLSLTGRYLSGKLKVQRAGNKGRREPERDWFSIVGATLHNLKNVTAHFPIGLLTCITGVSGSGKSSLINGTLYPALMNALHKAQETPAPSVISKA